MQSPQRVRHAAGPTAAAVQALPNPARPPIALVAPPSAGLRARQLLQEARKASVEQVGALQSALTAIQALLDDIAGGEEVYSPGIAAFAGRLREDLFWKSKTLDGLAQRQPQVDGPREG